MPMAMPLRSRDMEVGMKRSDSVFALLLCLSMIYYAAAGWEGRMVFPSGSGGEVYAEEAEEGGEAKGTAPGKKYSAEFSQEQRAYTVTAVDTRETCREEDGEYGIFRVCVRDGAGNIVQKFACKIPVRHVVNLEFDDLNFDGFPDLKIGYSNWKNDTNYCSLYLWNEREGKFGGEEICIPMEYEKVEERKMFQSISRHADVKKRVICRIGEGGELDKLRWWEIDEGTHRQTIGDGESGEILYEGPWDENGKEDFENEEDYEDIFWSGLPGAEESRVWWTCEAGGGQIVLQDLIPDQSLKLVFCKDGKEKIVRILRKYRDYENPKEYTGDVFETSLGKEGIYLWNHIYPKWRNTEYYVLDGAASENEKLRRLDEDWGDMQGEAGGREAEKKRKIATEPEIQREMERKMEFAEKLLQSDRGFGINREEYLAVFTNMPEREGGETYDEEREVRIRRMAVGDLDGDGIEDTAVIEIEEKVGYWLHIYMGKGGEAAGTADGEENLPEAVAGEFTKRLRMMDDECLYHSEIAILGNQVVITGKGGELFRGFQMVVFEWEKDGGVRDKLLLNGEGERGFSEAHWEVRDYETGERKFFAAEDIGEDIVELCPPEEYWQKKASLEEGEGEGADEIEIYEEFLRGEQGLYVKADSLYMGVNRFSIWQRYTLDDILGLLQMDYWMDGGGADRKIGKIEYAYLDCGGDGFRELAVRLVGMGICEAGDDSSITFLISCKNGRLELCYALETWCRSQTEIYYYGFMDGGGSNGGSGYVFDQLFLDADCEEKVIFRADEDWNIGEFGNCREDFEKIFTEGDEFHAPAMSITSYWIDDHVYRSYEIEETEKEEAEKCEEFIGILCRNGEKFCTEAEIEEIIREKRRQLGIKEEWMERRELQWEEMKVGNEKAAL